MQAENMGQWGGRQQFYRGQSAGRGEGGRGALSGKVKFQGRLKGRWAGGGGCWLSRLEYKKHLLG